MIRFSMLAVFLLTLAAPIQADDFQVLANADGVAPRQMMHRYLMAKVREAMDRRDDQYEELKTREQLVAYQQRTRRFFRKALGEFPERTPLNARVVATLDRDGYRVEKVIFESQPRHFVTAVLYLPDEDTPCPAVLVPCGHSGNGKASEAYQRVSILLAKSGLASLCYDPI